MKYKVFLINEHSNHEAAKHIEDEEMLIVVDENGDWEEADEFFSCNHVIAFEATLGEDDEYKITLDNFQ